MRRWGYQDRIGTPRRALSTLFLEALEQLTAHSIHLCLLNKEATDRSTNRKTVEEDTRLKMPAINSNSLRVQFLPVWLILPFVSNGEIIADNLGAAVQVRQINTTNWRAHNLLILK